MMISLSGVFGVLYFNTLSLSAVSLIVLILSHKSLILCNMLSIIPIRYLPLSPPCKLYFILYIVISVCSYRITFDFYIIRHYLRRLSLISNWYIQWWIP